VPVRFVILTVLLMWGLSGRCAIVRVAPGSAYSTIAAGLARVHGGDTLLVGPGRYAEGELVVNKRLTILGQAGAILDGESKTGLLVLRAPGIHVSGLHFRNVGRSDLKELSAIRVENTVSATLENNTIENGFFGIYLANASYCTVRNNRIYGQARTESGSGNGIHVWKSHHVFIDNNIIDRHRDGIYFEFVTDSKVYRNLSTHHLRYGIHFMFSDHDGYFYNTFRQNGSGVAVMYSHHVDMRHNDFSDNWGGAAYGLLLKEISHSSLIDNRFYGNTTGLYLEGSSDLVAERNFFSRNGWALRILGDCFEDTVRANTFQSNSFDVATNAERNMNYFHGNYWDKYRGYDLDKNGIGDVPYHPVSLFSRIAEQAPYALMLLHSFLLDIFEQAEKIVPTITPAAFNDANPVLHPTVHD
ncbi:MAG TPA: nitrous oxide reductase family maturation protein NosD, partial [Bacteroidia bacterium]|nr:nitrous oxide reductase family maturation protein NosD [Bacteroidia bacterium]